MCETGYTHDTVMLVSQNEPSKLPEAPKGNPGPFCILCDKRFKKNKRTVHSTVKDMLARVGLPVFQSQYHTVICDKCYKLAQVIALYVRDGNAKLLKIHRWKPGGPRNPRRRCNISLCHGKVRNQIPQNLYKEAFKISLRQPFSSPTQAYNDPATVLYVYGEELIDWADNMLDESAACYTAGVGNFKDVRVRPSGIHGYGLYASESIAAGEFVIEYTGRRITQSEADRRERINLANGMMRDYMFATYDGMVIDGTSKGSKARFMNHSCFPNVEARHTFKQGMNRILMFAVGDIGRNEELTFDYGMESSDSAEALCNCKDSNCRKPRF